LIAQLNEQATRVNGKKSTKLQRMIANLIAKATDAFDVFDANGKLIKEGTGDLAAITEIMNRIDGKPSQKLVGTDDGHSLQLIISASFLLKWPIKVRDPGLDLKSQPPSGGVHGCSRLGCERPDQFIGSVWPS
jgi:hypothetical protein